MNRLVILAPNWLGDAVMAEPAVVAVRGAMPESTVAVSGGPSVRSFFSMVPGIATLPIEELGRHSFDAALLLPNSFRSALVAYRARIPERWGYRTDWRGPLLTRAVERSSGVHQVASYCQLTTALGFPGDRSEPRVAVSDELRDAGADQLRAAGWDGRVPLVALAPGAAFGSAKRWPTASFAELVRELAADGVRSVLVGSAADRPLAQEIVGRLGTADPVLDLVGKNDVAHMAGVFANCRALVSNDSGAMHLGAAVGLAVTTTFGPTDERLTRPMGEAHQVLTHAVWCRPCMLRECPLDHACMRGIPVVAVAGAARRQL